MTFIQGIIILISSTLTGWVISWLIIQLLFWPVKPVSIAGIKLQGLLPASQNQLAHEAGQMIQKEFIAFKGLDEKLADPALIAQLKPEIEQHVDHFLNEKIKSVFPVISQFMGEKTILQFRSALLEEIDSLLPVLLKNYVGELKNEIRLDQMVEEKLRNIDIDQIRKMIFLSRVKGISLLHRACAFLGFFCGLLTLLILLIFNM